MLKLALKLRPLSIDDAFLLTEVPSRAGDNQSMLPRQALRATAAERNWHQRQPDPPTSGSCIGGG